MNTILRKLALALTLGSLLSFTALLAGCTQPPAEDVTTKPPVQVLPSSPRIVIEVMPEGSEESQRRHIFDANNVEIETQIVFRKNGSIASIKLRGDGTAQNYQLKTKTGKVIANFDYATDGKTIINGFRQREDGSTWIKYSQDATGAITTSTYWWDGTNVFTTLVTQPDGSYTAVTLHRNGTIWMKQIGPKQGTITRQEDYNNNGVLTTLREQNTGSTDLTLTTYDSSTGKPKYKQLFTVTVTDWGYPERKLQWIDQFNVDGSVRHIVMESTGGPYYYSSYPGTITLSKPDGTKVVRKIRPDGTVTHEEVFDANGKLASQQDFPASTTVKEQVDSNLMYFPYTDDPQQRWRFMEQYPEYRTQEPSK